MTTEELYEAKTYLKMDILKSYLAGQIDTFAYSKRKFDPFKVEDAPSKESPPSCGSRRHLVIRQKKNVPACSRLYKQQSNET